MIGRRGFITGLAAAFTAPAIVRASSLMPVKKMLSECEWVETDLFFRRGIFFVYEPLRLEPSDVISAANYGWVEKYPDEQAIALLRAA